MRAKHFLNEDWQKANKADKTDGMSQKAVNAYRRENPGSKLKTAVTTDPKKLKKGSESSNRRKSFCARSDGQRKMHDIDCSKTPDKAICKARSRWNCESVEDLEIALGEAKKDPCWKGYKQIGMKKKSGKQVPNCVPVNEADIGTNPKRPLRPGSRPERGHEPQKRYVTDRKTGKQYDPEEEFDKLKNSSEFQTQMKRMAAKEDSGISKGKETEFHAKLDKLVHNTFGKRDDEMAEAIPKGNEHDVRRKLIKYIASWKRWGISELELAKTDELIALYKQCQKEKKDWLSRRDDWWNRADALAKEKGISKLDALKQTPHDLDKGDDQASFDFRESRGYNPLDIPNPDDVHRPIKGDEPVKRGDVVWAQDPDNIATVHAGKVKRIGRTMVFLLLKNGEELVVPHDEVSKDYDVLSKRAHLILNKKGKSMSKYKVTEAKTEKKEPSKPRNFVAKNAMATTSGAGAHKDKKKAAKQGDVKHKKSDMDLAEMEEILEKASRKLCKSSTPDEDLGASNLASCKSQGLRARDGEKSHLIGHGNSEVRIKVGGKRIKGKKYGGPLPDYGTRKGQ